MKKIYVVTPAHNEGKYIKKTLKDILSVTKNIVFVDDGSTDNTFKIAKRLTKHAIRHEINLGKGAALKTGCEYAFGYLGASGVIFIDADGQHKATDLARAIRLIRRTPVIFGVRDLSKKMPLVRLIGNKFASIFMKAFFGSDMPDIPSGFKAISKKVYKKIKWDASGYEVEAEIAARVAAHKIPFSVLKIETIYHDRAKGVSLLDALNVMKFLIQLRLQI
jgi:glycosyltransferase involved in cell wall biosynthesis